MQCELGAKRLPGKEGMKPEKEVGTAKYAKYANLGILLTPPHTTGCYWEFKKSWSSKVLATNHAFVWLRIYLHRLFQQPVKQLTA